MAMVASFGRVPEGLRGGDVDRLSGWRRDAVRIITFRPQQFTKRGKQPVNRPEKTFNVC